MALDMTPCIHECHTKEVRIRLTPSMYDEFEKFRRTFHDGKLSISETIRTLIKGAVQQSCYQAAE